MQTETVPPLVKKSRKPAVKKQKVMEPEEPVAATNATKEKKPPTEKQLAARERARVAREVKKEAEQTERLKELYRQSAVQKAVEEKEAAKEVKKRESADKRRAAKKVIVKSAGTVDIPGEQDVGMAEEYAALDNPRPQSNRKKPVAFGYEDSGITPLPDLSNGVDFMMKPTVGQRPQTLKRMR